MSLSLRRGVVFSVAGGGGLLGGSTEWSTVMVLTVQGCLTPGDVTEELLDSFFEAEVELEKKICRDVVCTSHKDEEGKEHTHAHTFEEQAR